MYTQQNLCIMDHNVNNANTQNSMAIRMRIGYISIPKDNKHTKRLRTKETENEKF